jgi:uncharacterized GH25 family protein
MNLATHNFVRVPMRAGVAVLLALAACRTQVPRTTEEPMDVPKATEQVAVVPNSADQRTEMSSDSSWPTALSIALDAGQARLCVRVLARENDAPIKDPDLTFVRDDGKDEADGDDWEERFGWQETTVPAGVALRLEVDSHGDFASKSFAVEALTEGEQRKIVLRVATADDLVFFGRLIDAQSGAAIGDGTVQLEGFGSGKRAKSAVKIATDPDGTFELSAASWRLDFARAFSPKSARATFALSRGHATRDQALTVELSRSATIEAQVRDRAGAPVQGARVKVSSDSSWLDFNQGTALDFRWRGSNELEWSAKTDSSGRCVLEDVASNSPLVVELQLEGLLAKREVDVMVLAPQERRSLNFVADAGAVITGTVLDQHGQPVKDCSLALFHGDGDARTIFEFGEQPVASAKSDEQGRFRFVGVPSGPWCLGPANTDTDGISYANGTVTGVVSLGDQTQRPGLDVAPVGTALSIEPGVASIDTMVRADIGLHIRGMVRDPGGQPATDAHIRLESDDSLVVSDKYTEDDGTFDVGPVSAGKWTVVANGEDEGFGKSQPIEIDAGASDVALDLPQAAALLARIVDPHALPGDESIVVIAPEGKRTNDVDFRVTGSGGWFEFRGVEPGEYNLFALGTDGCVVFETTHIGRESDSHSRTLEDLPKFVSRPGARLRVRFSGAPRMCTCRVSVAGMPLYNALAFGTRRFGVPTGDVVVELFDDQDRSLQKQTVHLTAGEERELVFDAP